MSAPTLEEVYGSRALRRRYICHNGGVVRRQVDEKEGNLWRENTSKFMKVIINSFYPLWKVCWWEVVLIHSL